MIRVLLVSPVPPPAGGIATWTVRVMGSTLGERVDLRLVDDTAVRLAEKQSGFTRANVAFAARLLRRITREGLTWKPQVVHLSVSAQFPGVLRELLLARVARGLGAKTIVHLHGSKMDDLRGTGRMARLARRLLPRVDRVVVLNRAMRELMADVGVTAVEIANPVDLQPLPERPPHDGPVRVLYVGWMLRAKGVFELMDALEATPGVHLTLLGRIIHNDDDDAFLARVASLGDRVSFPGEVPGPEVWRFYAEADVFVLPSWTEGMPNALLEAMMSGLPSIVTPVGAMAEMVEGSDAGIVVPVRDAAALGAAMRRLADDAVLRRAMGDRARAAALRDYETEAVVSRLERLYRELADG